jgi:hypothetical protein
MANYITSVTKLSRCFIIIERYSSASLERVADGFFCPADWKWL